MRISLIMAVCALLMHGADSFDTWFKEGNVSGNLRYYYIETNKDFITGEQNSAHSNAVGGQLKYATSKWKGLQLGTTFMTTQPFLLPEHVESSTIGLDNGFRGDDPSKSYSVLGEVYADYSNENGLVTTATVKAPRSLQITAMTVLLSGMDAVLSQHLCSAPKMSVCYPPL